MRLALVCLLCVACDGEVFIPHSGLQQTISGTTQNQVDVLFVVDNSPSMRPKQTALIKRFPNLLGRLNIVAANAQPAHYHIGVITTDLGANQFVDSLKQCREGGDGAVLQVRGKAADDTCPTELADGVRYLDYDQTHPDDKGQPSTNLPAGMTVETQFGCMAAVGDQGCGFEQSLEAAYRALHDPPADNSGFLREAASLVVFWVTDEDDCSAPTSSNVFSPTATAPPPDGLGLLNSFRCVSFGVRCSNEAPPYGSSSGPLANCRSVRPGDSNPSLFSVDRYLSFFKQRRAEGGLKDDPNNVILVALDAPEDPFEVIVGIPGMTGQPPCDGPLGQNCAVMVKHSCTLASDTRFFGDPAVRLNEVVRASSTGLVSTICNDDYSDVIHDTSVLIEQNLRGGCIAQPFLDPTAASCSVTDVTPNGDGTKTTRILERCDRAGGQKPCWHIVDEPTCPAVCARNFDPAQRPMLAVDRDEPRSGLPITHFSCTVIDPFFANMGVAPTCSGTP